MPALPEGLILDEFGVIKGAPLTLTPFQRYEITLRSAFRSHARISIELKFEHLINRGVLFNWRCRTGRCKHLLVALWCCGVSSKLTQSTGRSARSFTLITELSFEVVEVERLSESGTPSQHHRLTKSIATSDSGRWHGGRCGMVAAESSEVRNSLRRRSVGSGDLLRVRPRANGTSSDVLLIV